MNKQNERIDQEKHRMFLLDIVRILCALLIYMRHSITMFGCTYYGYYTNEVVLLLTDPVMSCFFLLSGFSIHYQHITEEISAFWIRSFLKKRLITIMPSYLLVVLIWPLTFPSMLKDWVILLPVELFGIQTAYDTLFGILHNGGTWFVSCIIMAYIIYPVIKAILGSAKAMVPAIILVVSHFLLIYSNVVISRYSLEWLYPNPIARSAEFMIGVAFAELVFTNKHILFYKQMIFKQKAFFRDGKMQVFCIILIVSLISGILAFLTHSGKKMLFFEYLPTPVILMVLLLASFIRSKKFENNRILNALSGMSYQFFLVQLFLWNITAWVMNIIGVKGNMGKIIVSLTLCTGISFFVWKFYDKPVRRLLTEKLLTK